MLAWHPDKNLDNPDKFKEQFLELTEAWEVFKKGPPTGGIYCDESFDNFDFEFDWDKDDGQSEAEEDTEYNESPYDDDFFHPSPKKGFAVPEDLRQFFRSSSNRRAGKCFALFTLQSKLKEIEVLYDKLNIYKGATNCFVTFKASTNKEIFVVLINYASEHRLGDLKKQARKIDLMPLEIVYAVKHIKFYQYLLDNYGEPVYSPCAPKAPSNEKPDSKAFNHKTLVEFAKTHQISDCMELMYDYAHLAETCDYPVEKITREHEEDHEGHFENAKIFIYMSDRKKICKNAIEVVFAELYVTCKRESPLDYLNKKCKEIGYNILEIDDIDFFGLADFYSKHHIYNFVPLAKLILDSFCYGLPRKRYTILQGDFKCGKSVFASAFNKLFGGVSINLNVDAQRLHFYLGNAIGRRFVLFDDVKGDELKRRGDSMYTGPGLQNLDNLRDHLDGNFEVQLEKKNQQPIEQIFPAGIITCNNYVIKDSIRERVQGPKKMRASPRWEIHPLQVTLETIYVCCVINNLLPAESNVHRHIEQKRSAWWTKHAMSCDCLVSNLYHFQNGGGTWYTVCDRWRDYRRRYCIWISSSSSGSSSGIGSSFFGILDSGYNSWTDHYSHRIRWRCIPTWCNYSNSRFLFRC